MSAAEIEAELETAGRELRDAERRHSEAAMGLEQARDVFLAWKRILADKQRSASPELAVEPGRPKR